MSYIVVVDDDDNEEDGVHGEEEEKDDVYNADAMMRSSCDPDPSESHLYAPNNNNYNMSNSFAAFTCPICLDRIESAEQSFSIRPCGHRYDRECLSHYLNTSIEQAKTNIGCPDPNCTQVPCMHEEDMKRLVDADTFRKFQDFTFAKQFMRIRGARFCVSPECQSALVGSDADDQQVLKCDMCGTEQCFQCRREWHPDQTCEERAATDTVDSKFVNYAKRHKTRQCPRCHIVTSKIKGCNRMLSKKRNESKRKQSKDTNESFFTIARYDMSILSLYVFFCQLALS
jgi:IBR domain, a half RING-finger domain/Ring finger domain